MAEDEFLKELAKIHQYWVAASSKALTDETESLIGFDHEEGIRELQDAIKAAGCQAQVQPFIEQVVAGVVHSILAGLDGAGELKENCGVSLVTKHGVPLKPFLHELWPRFYLEPVPSNNSFQG